MDVRASCLAHKQSVEPARSTRTVGVVLAGGLPLTSKGSMAENSTSTIRVK